jgi:hypothetical protein
MGVEEWANCRRGRVRESKCGMMVLTQAQLLLPPIKEEWLLPVSCIRYTQMKSQGSEEFLHGFATAVGWPILAQVYSKQPQEYEDQHHYHYSADQQVDGAVHFCLLLLVSPLSQAG